MTRQNPVRTLNCPNCGAPLNFPPGRDTATCAYCSSVVERTDDAPNQEEEKHTLRIDLNDLGEATVQRANVNSKRFVVRMRQGQPVVIDLSETLGTMTGSVTPAPKPKPTKPRTQSFGCGWALFVLVMVGIGPFIGLMAFLSESGALAALVAQINQATGVTVPQVFGSGYYARGSALLLPSQADTSRPDILVLAFKPGESGKSYVVMVDGTSQTTRWASEALDNDDYRAALVFTADRVFAVLGDRIYSFDRATGQTRWVNSLVDSVRFGCRACVRVLGDLIMVYTQDGTLQTFALSDGTPDWSTRAWSDTAYEIYGLGDYPAIGDYDETSRTSVLRLFEPASGNETRIEANCGSASNTGSRLGSSAALGVTPDGTAFYLVQRDCVEKFTLPDGALIWRTQPDRSFSPETGAIMVLEAGFITYAYDQVWLFEATSGTQVQIVANNDEYAYYRPLIFHDGQLLLLATRTRGTRRDELWAVDVVTGVRRWQRVLDDNQSLAESNGGIISDGEYAWTTHLTNDGLWFLSYVAGETDTTHFASVEKLNWATGASEGEKKFNLGLDTLILSAPIDLGWTENRYHWGIVESGILAVDVVEGAPIFNWKPR